MLQGLARTEVGIDWFRASGPMGDRFDRVLSWAAGWWGPPEECYGKHHYAKGYVWATGAQVWYTPSGDKGPNAGRFTLEVPGSVLAEWTAAERVAEVVRLLSFGIVPRRLDLALDLFGDNPQFIRQINAACERGELCYVREVSYIAPTSGGHLKGESLYLGARSSQGRYLCAYDKGLEQDRERYKRGEWLRLEGRFAGVAAVHACLALRKAAAGGGDMGESDGIAHVAASSWAEESVGLILGVVDFREPRRGASRSVQRRAVASWWAAFCGQVRRVRLRGAGVRTPSLAGFKRSFQRCYWRTILGLMEATGQTLSEVLAYLADGENRTGGRSVVLAEYRREQLQRRAVA